MAPTRELTIDELPLNENVRVLAHNEDGLLALEKPVGAISHPNTPEADKRAILTAPYDLEEECYRWTDRSGCEQLAWLINRLDSPTSGVILVGLNPEISRLIKQEFATHKVSKIYYAVVKGVPAKPAGVWADKLSKDIQRGKRLIKNARFVPAKARYQSIKSPTGGFPVTLLKLLPVTGRTHQLRVQCKKHGLPIVGDRTYGSFSFSREVSMHTGVKRMLLHSAETHVHYAFQGKVRDFVAKSTLPEAFEAVLRYRPGLSHGQATKASHSALAGRRFKR
jgi:23S rRNA-/tRNA-specific pseudouridylate synthase